MNTETTSTRLKMILKDRNLRQVDLLELVKPFCEQYNVKMNKSDISQYLSGLVKPGQEKLVILGMALNVNESWLMGCDVPMEKSLTHEESSTNSNPVGSEETGELIKNLRIEKGLTQEALGNLLGLKKETINTYENGRVENIKRSITQEMAEIFEVTPAYLMGWEYEKKEIKSTYNPNKSAKKDDKNIIDRIKKRRLELSLSYQELADKTGLSKSTLQRYETGYIKNMPIDKIEILSSALDVTPAYLMGWEEPEKKEIRSTYNPNVITEKDEKSIQKDLKKIMDDFKSGQDGPAFYNGVELDEEELELIEQAMELALRSAKIKNKAKYTPKKYRK